MYLQKHLYPPVIISIGLWRFSLLIVPSVLFAKTTKIVLIILFWQCSCIKRFWQILETLSKLNAKCNITFQAGITSNLVLFGLDSDNSVILFAKHYIYQCKRNMSLPRVDIFQKQLQLRYKVEEYNAKILSRDTFILYKS